MLVDLGVAVVTALSRRWRLLRVAGGLSLNRVSTAGPLSVAEML